MRQGEKEGKFYMTRTDLKEGPADGELTSQGRSLGTLGGEAAFYEVTRKGRHCFARRGDS